ncbi:hypothetical protein Ahy_A02g007637 [Arachis hypogaea]|uniref:Aminotransferase-like plant mobile domain-containing protein n=1 Tax=Arachis hypogaea TaxID=3818 RepID=A0A445EDC0_ARAHY|nr:hypothetical protein Ahy_A02g007637 [Arachis hypogaea]
MIFGLPTDGLPVTGMTLSSFETLEAEYLHQFRVALRMSDCRGSCIKLTWLRNLKERWGSACLAHLYKALCRVSRFNYKKIDGPLTLLLVGLGFTYHI